MNIPKDSRLKNYEGNKEIPPNFFHGHVAGKMLQGVNVNTQIIRNNVVEKSYVDKFVTFRRDNKIVQNFKKRKV